MNNWYRRFGDFQRLLTAGHSQVSLNAFVPEPEQDAEGNLIPCPAPRIELNCVEALRLL